jgi:hypothetical protein
MVAVVMGVVQVQPVALTTGAASSVTAVKAGVAAWAAVAAKPPPAAASAH